MDISVSICTWNRCESLRRTLASLVEMRTPINFRWEVIVVNNNSTDQTDSVIDSFSNLLPVVRCFEGAAGLSNARNKAVACAKGKYILWTDDDVVVDPMWLVAYLDAFERWPHAALFGGPIRPRFDGAMPHWLRDGWKSIEVAFCANDLGPDPIPLSPRMLPFGANFAIRREDQVRVLYDRTLGVQPGGQLMGEEIAVMRRLLREGATGWWVPKASVVHCNSAERMTLSYIKNYFERLGRTQWVQSFELQQKKIGRPRWLWRQVVERQLRYLSARAFLQPEQWLERLSESSIAWGAFKQSAIAPPQAQPTDNEPAK
jgi:GT2 family glycosyltransferase